MECEDVGAFIVACEERLNFCALRCCCFQSWKEQAIGNKR